MSWQKNSEKEGFEKIARIPSREELVEWEKAGFTKEEMKDWLSAGFIIPKVAKEWKEVGWNDPDEAYRWYKADWEPLEAFNWYWYFRYTDPNWLKKFKKIGIDDPAEALEWVRISEKYRLTFDDLKEFKEEGFTVDEVIKFVRSGKKKESNIKKVAIKDLKEKLVIWMLFEKYPVEMKLLWRLMDILERRGYLYGIEQEEYDRLLNLMREEAKKLEPVVLEKLEKAPSDLKYKLSRDLDEFFSRLRTI